VPLSFQLFLTGVSTFPELQGLETRIGDFALTEKAIHRFRVADDSGVEVSFTEHKALISTDLSGHYRILTTVTHKPRVIAE
jgi:hypothetical protein